MNDDATAQNTIHRSTRRGLTNSVLGTRNLMITAALAVVGSIIVVALSYLSATMFLTPRGLLVACSVMGAWLIPYLLPAVIVRKPGAALIAGLIMGIISAFTTPSGPAAIIGNVLGGAFIEVPLALLRYRVWTWWSFAISGCLFGCINGLLYLGMVHFAASGGMSVAIVAVSIASSLVGVAACLLIRSLLARAGVGATGRR